MPNKNPKGIYQGFNDRFIEFYRNDQHLPILTIAADTLKIYNDRAEVYVNEFSYPIATVIGWHFWKEWNH